MPFCSICIDELKRPVSLPCGHVFCNDCVYRTVTALKSYATLHYCPTCRAPYTTVNMDASMVPHHLRPHVLPHIRRLFIDEQRISHSDKDVSKSSPTSTECSRLSCENSNLRFNCDMWQKRAQVHAAATMGLVEVARSSRSEAARLRTEMAELEQKYNILKRKVDADETFKTFSSASSASSSSSSSSTTPAYICPSVYRPSLDRPAACSGSSIKVSADTSRPQAIAISAWTDIARNIQQDIAEPSAKRRRVEASPTNSPISAAMVATHDINRDFLPPSLSRRTLTPPPSTTLS